MSKIRVGVQVHQNHTTYESYAKAISTIDQIGVDTIWNWDHFFPMYGEENGHHFEGWTLLTAMAMLTKQAEIGCLVLCNSYRNPAMLSQMAKTLDHISGGRLILGLGSGWFEKDYTEYDFEFGTALSRLQDLDKSLPIIKHRWEIDLPKPMRNPIPILIGGSGEKVTLRITAQYADMWNSFGPAETYKHKNGVLNNWCEKLGRDPNEIERTIMVGRDNLDQLDDFVEAGATHVMISVNDEPWQFDAVEKLVKWRDSVNG
ncbi:MAG: LLM class F420-dependent oxidoreductase [Chloroflexota bacterium]